MLIHHGGQGGEAKGEWQREQKREKEVALQESN